MVLDSIPWKEELQKLIDELTTIALPFEYDEDDKRDFLIERALIYSAFVARLLLDSRKTTDLKNGYCMAVGVIPNILENPEHILPLFRIYPERDYYDFENERTQSVPCRRILNQVIHSFVIPTYEVDDAGFVVGFFVASDQYANSHLYRIDLESWVKYLKSIVDDDITSTETHFDREKGQWKEVRR